MDIFQNLETRDFYHSFKTLEIDRSVVRDDNVFSVTNTKMQSVKKQLIFILYCLLFTWASAKNLYDEYNDKLDLMSDYENRQEETSENSLYAKSNIPH